MSCTSITRIFAAAALLMVCAPLRAELSAEELAKLAQNPIANLISVPFQENANFNYGPLKKTQNVFNIEPVIPFEVNKDWNVITRTIIPVISQPALFPGDTRTNGIGETQFSAFLSPANPVNGLVWGVGAITQLPTTSDSALGPRLTRTHWSSSSSTISVENALSCSPTIERGSSSSSQMLAWKESSARSW